MIFRHEHQGGVWVDLEQPNQQEIRDIANEFNISERIETELLSPTPFPLAASDGDVALLVLHFAAHDGDEGETRDQEVDFVVGKHFVITVRYEVVAPLHRLRKLLETEALVDGHSPLTTEMLLEVLFAHLYASVRDHTNHVASHLTRLEHDMFEGKERTTVRAISSLSREFLHLESALANQEEPLARLLKELSRPYFFGTTFTERAARTLAERTQVARLVETHRAVASELRETNAMLLESRQSEIMKTLTILSVVVLPLELIAFVLGMHAGGTPIIDDPNGFWIIMTIMAATVFVMTLYFARKRWL